MARPKTTNASKLRNTITTFLSKLPEAERAEVLAAVTEAAIDDTDAMLTEAQGKEAQRLERAEAKAAREASVPEELREARPVATLRKAVKNVKPGDLRPEDLRDLKELVTQLLALLSGSSPAASEDKGSQATEALTPAA